MGYSPWDLKESDMAKRRTLPYLAWCKDWNRGSDSPSAIYRSLCELEQAAWRLVKRDC